MPTEGTTPILSPEILGKSVYLSAKCQHRTRFFSFFLTSSLLKFDRLILFRFEKNKNLIYFVQTRREHVIRLDPENQIFHNRMGRVDVYIRQKVSPLHLYHPSVPLLVRHHVQALIEIPELIQIPLQQTGWQFRVRI